MHECIHLRLTIQPIGIGHAVFHHPLSGDHRIKIQLRVHLRDAAEEFLTITERCAIARVIHAALGERNIALVQQVCAGMVLLPFTATGVMLFPFSVILVHFQCNG